MLAVMSVAAYAPAAHAATFYNLSVTVTAGTQSSTGTFRIVDVNSDGIISVTVVRTFLFQIQTAFGTTTFALLGSYSGTFTANGFTFIVTLETANTFPLVFKA